MRSTPKAQVSRLCWKRCCAPISSSARRRFSARPLPPFGRSKVRSLPGAAAAAAPGRARGGGVRQLGEDEIVLGLARELERPAAHAHRCRPRAFARPPERGRARAAPGGRPADLAIGLGRALRREQEVGRRMAEDLGRGQARRLHPGGIDVQHGAGAGAPITDHDDWLAQPIQFLGQPAPAFLRLTRWCCHRLCSPPARGVALAGLRSGFKSGLQSSETVQL